MTIVFPDDPERAGLSPLCILLTAMREKWQAGDRDGAVAIARTVAPYLHPRAVAASGRLRNDPAQLTDDEIAGRILAARSEAAARDPDLFD